MTEIWEQEFRKVVTTFGVKKIRGHRLDEIECLFVARDLRLKVYRVADTKC